MLLAILGACHPEPTPTGSTSPTGETGETGSGTTGSTGHTGGAGHTAHTGEPGHSAAHTGVVESGWAPMASAGAPSERTGAATAWSGTELLVWSGIGADPRQGPRQDGAAYDPVTDAWRTLGRAGAPTGRAGAVGAWSGTELLVYGGANEEGDTGGPFARGGRYAPAADAWTTFGPLAGEQGRVDHGGAWTGDRLCVWGGRGMDLAAVRTGGCFDPVAGTWDETTTTGAPAARLDPTVTWTGSRLLVFGGFSTDTAQSVGTGGSYDPATDRWSALPPTPSRRNHTAVWTGTELVVWGGARDGVGTSAVVNDGGAFDPVAGTWRPVSTRGAPSPRELHAAVWTGTRMIVWGGRDAPDVSGVPLDDGAAWDPASDTWTPLPTAGAPTARVAPIAAWTGRAMVVWGGADGDGRPTSDAGAVYTP